MQILGVHILTNRELKRQREQATSNQREISNRLVANLLRINEEYRAKNEELKEAAVKYG